MSAERNNIHLDQHRRLRTRWNLGPEQIASDARIAKLMFSWEQWLCGVPYNVSS